MIKDPQLLVGKEITSSESLVVKFSEWVHAEYFLMYEGVVHLLEESPLIYFHFLTPKIFLLTSLDTLSNF